MKRKIVKFLKTTLICFGLCVTGFIYTHAQQIAEIKPTINIPTSPEASTLGSYGKENVNLYIGQPSINIPLFTIQENGIEIPISLTYSNSGIKVSDDATWVGLGWNLTGESMIIQEVRGSIDELDSDVSLFEPYMTFRQRLEPLPGDYGFLFQMGRVSHNSSYCSDMHFYGPPYNDYIGDKIGALDLINSKQGEPDIFRYNIGNLSGSFYINPETKEIVFINPQEKVLIERNNANTIFVLTNLDGARYTFSTIEKVYPTESFDFSGKTLKLTSITFLNGDEIVFDYDDHIYYTYEYLENVQINSFDGASQYNQSHSSVKHDVKTLKRIISKQTEIVFNHESREDLLLSNKPRLKSIDIYTRALQNKIKTIEFNHNYFEYNTIGTNIPLTGFISDHSEELGKRLRLDFIKEIGYINDSPIIHSSKSHYFEYDLSNTMPLKCSFAKDFWGYFNGSNNDSLLPDLEYFDFLNKGDLEVINQTLEYPYVGANRFTNNLKAGAYLLKKIIYPTGGYSEIEYEPNSFANQFIPDQSSNVRKPHYLTEEPANYNNTFTSFTPDRAITLHFQNSIRNYSLENPQLTIAQMAGSKIYLYKMRMVSGIAQLQSIIKEWNLDGITNQEFMINNGAYFDDVIHLNFDPDPDVFYTVSVDFPQVLSYPTYYGIGVSSSFYYYDHTGVDDSESKQFGMRVKSIKNYESVNALTSHKEYIYYGGKLKNTFKPLFFYFANYCNQKAVVGGVSYEYAAFYKKITLSSNMFDLLARDAIGYDTVIEIDKSNGNPANGKIEYIFINEMNTLFHDCPITDPIGNGLIKREKYYDENDSLVKDVNYFYDFVSAPEYQCIKSVTLATGNLQLCGNFYSINSPGAQAFYDVGGPLYASIYGFDIYKIKNRKVTLYKKTVKQLFNSSTIESVFQFQYNDIGQVSIISEKNSDGLYNTTKLYYPFDKMVDPVLEEKLVQVYNIGKPSLILLY